MRGGERCLLIEDNRSIGADPKSKLAVALHW